MMTISVGALSLGERVGVREEDIPMGDVATWESLAQQLRVDSVRVAAQASSGHPTSSMSSADLAAVLLNDYLRYDLERPDAPNNDHLVFSKGHASPLIYGMLKAAGAIDEEEFLTYRTAGSRLEGHPVPNLPTVDVATGSLGQGLPIAVGIALAGKRLDKLPYRVWVFCGDSEMAEGSMWEAVEHAALWELDNLTAIIDVNRLGQRGETMYGWDTGAYAARLQAFGWHTVEIDGHDVDAINTAYQEAVGTQGRPTAIIARTMKGRGASAVQDKEGFHGRPLEDAEAAIAELGGATGATVTVPAPANSVRPNVFSVTPSGSLPAYELGSNMATRRAYGDALAAVGARRGDVVALDGEVGNSTYAEIFAKAHPERFFECYIAEQQAVAAAVGMNVRGWTPYVSTFAAFLTRAYDFIRMASVSRANVRFCGSHAGVSIGEDGPSQMALEDIAMMRAVHGSTVLYPSDANQTAQLVAAMADLDGISYIRTTRAATPILYEPDEVFRVGGSRVLRSSDNDALTIVAAGITVHESLKAVDAMAADGINVRLIDLYSVKPIDADTLEAAARDTGTIVTVEDHWAEGGVGDAVLAALGGLRNPPRVVKLAVQGMPGSGKPADLLSAAGIDAAHIEAAVHLLAQS